MVVFEVDIVKVDLVVVFYFLLLNGDVIVVQKNLGLVVENNLCSQYEEKVCFCIDFIDFLWVLGVEQDLVLLVIVVIGDQSLGKSFVLEVLLGVVFFRGSGIVIRCLLVLKLKKFVNEDKWRGKVSYQDYEIEILDVLEVEKEINKVQNVIIGEGMGISYELIILEISF